MKCYITFGQIDTHSISGKTLDHDCVAELTADSLKSGHEQAMEIFNKKFHNCTESPPDMEYYPRGIIAL